MNSDIKSLTTNRHEPINTVCCHHTTSSSKCRRETARRSIFYRL